MRSPQSARSDHVQKVVIAALQLQDYVQVRGDAYARQDFCFHSRPLDCVHAMGLAGTNEDKTSPWPRKHACMP